jgi:uncharacterized protein
MRSRSSPRRIGRPRPLPEVKRGEPERTCVGCRLPAAKGRLIRVVRAPDGTVSIDPTGRMPGRGAYLHPSAECARLAMRRRALGRALRATLAEPEAARLMEQLSGRLGEVR